MPPKDRLNFDEVRTMLRYLLRSIRQAGPRRRGDLRGVAVRGNDEEFYSVTIRSDDTEV
jgi:hypothetical protein